MRSTRGTPQAAEVAREGVGNTPRVPGRAEAPLPIETATAASGRGDALHHPIIIGVAVENAAPPHGREKSGIAMAMRPIDQELMEVRGHFEDPHMPAIDDRSPYRMRTRIVAHNDLGAQEPR